MDEHQSLRQEAEGLRRQMARVWERMRFFEPWNRPETEEEKLAIQRLYIELGKLTRAHSHVWRYGGIKQYRCPCCGMDTLDSEPPGTYENCMVCWWEDDPLQFDDPDMRGGANQQSLNEAREAFRRHGIIGPPSFYSDSEPSLFKSRMMDAPFQQLLTFLNQLEEAHLAYDLKHVRDSVMVVAYVPQGYCEIEFFPDGNIEVEWSRRDGDVKAVGLTWLDEFIAQESG